jgi:hypothetical protein
VLTQVDLCRLQLQDGCAQKVAQQQVGLAHRQ